MTKWPSCLSLNTWKFLHVPKAHLEASPWPPRQGPVHPNWGDDITEFLWTWITNCLKGRFRPQGTTYTFKICCYIHNIFPELYSSIQYRFLFLCLAKRDVIYGENSTPLCTAHALHHIVPYAHWFFSEVTMEVKNIHANQISVWTIIIALGLKWNYTSHSLRSFKIASSHITSMLSPTYLKSYRVRTGQRWKVPKENQEAGGGIIQGLRF